MPQPRHLLAGRALAGINGVGGRAAALAWNHVMTSPTPYPISLELSQLLALRRVRRGHVVLVGHDLLVGHGWRDPDYICALVRELIDDGHLYLGDEWAGWAPWPVLVTPSGEQLHAELEELRR